MEERNASGPEEEVIYWGGVSGYGSFNNMNLEVDPSQSYSLAPSNSRTFLNGNHVGPQSFNGGSQHVYNPLVASTYHPGGAEVEPVEAGERRGGIDSYNMYDTTTADITYSTRSYDIDCIVAYTNTADHSPSVIMSSFTHGAGFGPQLTTATHVTPHHTYSMVGSNALQEYNSTIQSSPGLWAFHGQSTGSSNYPPHFETSQQPNYPYSPYASTHNENRGFAPLLHDDASHTGQILEVGSSSSLQMRQVRNESSSTAAYTSQSMSPNHWATEGDAFGYHITRTSSPEHLTSLPKENFQTGYGHRSELETGTLDSTVSNLTTTNSTDSDSSRPILPGSSTSKFSSRTQSGEGTGRRIPTPAQRKQTRDVRAKSACERCYLSRKRCECSDPCHECQRADVEPYLRPVLCYGFRRTFQKLLFGRPDMFSIKPRQAFIDFQLRSMKGDKRYFWLGTGQRAHGDKITIDVDSENVLCVEIQDVDKEPVECWHSTDDSALTSKSSQHNITSYSYGIVPESLPTHSTMDHWVRQHTASQANDQANKVENQPYDDLAAAIDIFLLQYSRLHPDVDIVQCTIRIANLGRFTDSRRPVDHEEVVKLLNHLASDNPPKNFGPHEFNEAKEKFRLSMTVTQQLHVQAAYGIEEAERRLGHTIDDAFEKRRHGTKADELFIIGVCILRLILEYRQRLERYRCFHPGLKHFDERIRGCIYMYTLYTCLYELWSRESSIRLSKSSKRKVSNTIYPFNDNGKLVNTVKDVRRLEIVFSSETVYESKGAEMDDDSFYRSQIENLRRVAIRR